MANAAGILENDDGRVSFLVVGFHEHDARLVVVTNPGVVHLASAAFSCTEYLIASFSGRVDADVDGRVGSAPPR